MNQPTTENQSEGTDSHNSKQYATNINGNSRNGGSNTDQCSTTTARGLLWEETHFGENRHVKCPNNHNTFAQWRCNEINGLGIWENNWPDLSRCRSNWVELLMMRNSNSIKRIQNGHQILTLTDQVYNHLNNHPREIFGGDFGPLLTLMQSHIKSMKINIENKLLQQKRILSVGGKTKEQKFLETTIETSSVRKLSSIISNVLNVRSIYAWRDLLGNKNMHAATVAKFMDVSENLGAVISLMMTGSEKKEYFVKKKSTATEKAKATNYNKEMPLRFKEDHQQQIPFVQQKGNAFIVSTSWNCASCYTTKINTPNLCK